MKNLIKKLEAQSSAAKDQIDFYSDMEIQAQNDKARREYEIEKNFWLGMRHAANNALAMVVQEEATGGSPFNQ